MSFQDGFSPAEGSCKTDWTGSAVTISGGYTFVDVYRFASEHGHIIVGGDDPVSVINNKLKKSQNLL